MAKKAKTMYVCQECGYDTPRWLGKCPGCGAWNTLVEERVAPEPAAGAGGRATPRSRRRGKALPDR